MFYTILEDLILYQQLAFKPSKYSNYELKLFKYFYDKTQIDLSFLIIMKIEGVDFIFLFVKQDKYFEARSYLKSIRHQINLVNKKVMIIRVDNILINLIFNLFPDLCIHDIEIETNNLKRRYEISICFLKDLNTYHIAVGQNGSYIKAINKLFDNHISFKNVNTPLTIKCKAVN